MVWSDSFDSPDLRHPKVINKAILGLTQARAAMGTHLIENLEEPLWFISGKFFPWVGNSLFRFYSLRIASKIAGERTSRMSEKGGWV